MSDLQKVLSLTVILIFCKLKAVGSFTKYILPTFALVHFPLPSTFANIIVFPSDSALSDFVQQVGSNPNYDY